MSDSDAAAREYLQVGVELPKRHEQLLLLTMLGDSKPNGQELATRHESLTGETASDATLYRSLSTLVDEGLLEREAVDDRSHAYRVTDYGRAVLQSLSTWRFDIARGMQPPGPIGRERLSDRVPESSLVESQLESQ